MRTVRNITLALACALAVATLLVACHHPAAARSQSTASTAASEVTAAAEPSTTSTSTTSTTTTTEPPPVATRAPVTSPPATRPPATDPPATAAKARSGCPPDPEIPGVAYYCGPGVAEGHRGQTCINHPPECAPGTASISVDPTIGDAYCALANEEDNYAHGGAQRDIYGTCPLTHTGPDITLVIDVAVIAMVGAILIMLVILIRKDHHHR